MEKMAKLDFNAGRHWVGQFRDAKGRFCTSETYRVEKVAHENKRLQLESEKNLRMYLAIAKEYSRVLRENQMLKQILLENGLEYRNVAR